MSFRRGFKSQCERRSVEIRRTLGLSETDPLDASKLANHMGIDVWSANDVSGLTQEDQKILNDENDDSWSALTLMIDNHHLVIYKPVRSKRRINSVIMHELSHIVLGHQMAQATVSSDGMLMPSFFSQENEDEANWLGGTLLLPRPALLHIRRNELSDHQAMKMYLVSDYMFKWRIRMTGVDYQLKHAQKKYG